MADPFTSEIRPFAFNFAPENWAFCNGQEIQATQNAALFALLGTQFGGNGVSNFKLPDLRGRTPIGQGIMKSEPSRLFTAGDQYGVENVTISVAEMAGHSHSVQATSTEAVSIPAFTDRVFASSKDLKGTATEPFTYNSAANLTGLAQDVVSSAGGGQSHTNIQPLLALNFCIALDGIFPARN
ncbi:MULTISPECIES: phage tail protein [Pseudoalteromonas]|uniref:Phage tail protein n=1 Tax=Pseudoalteromonas fuliginea TaxID=1872678 RepID=A0ABQ6RIG4_9GAMM|nr:MULTISPECIES: tail fiber protein [Pseudoalteromonas]KAA1156636.1 phage tail protein [Pseudoalteromonas fuliginea]KAA1167465.1 phage tail protein [Pseudoalteromonas fuliginea]MDQ2042387.1 tail fiber protein [Pseudoalteromonas sp. 20-92]